jgi:hypothetical protein
MKDIWKDPSVYDGMTDGPPYLPKPGSGIAKLAASATDQSSHLALLVAWHRALFAIHQTHHWQTRGTSYYADHQLAERAIGTGDVTAVALRMQLGLLNQVLDVLYKDVPADVPPEQMPAISLSAEETLLQFLRVSYDVLEKAGTLTMGVDDLLQAIASKHEEFVYLLKQRNKVANDPWKL